jgi:hypothetical protein
VTIEGDVFEQVNNEFSGASKIREVFLLRACYAEETTMV